MYDSGSKRTGRGPLGWGSQDNHKGSARLFLGNLHKYEANLAPRTSAWFLLYYYYYYCYYYYHHHHRYE